MKRSESHEKSLVEVRTPKNACHSELSNMGAGTCLGDELQIARWRDGSDVVPTFLAALPLPGGGRATKKVPHGSRSSRASARFANTFTASEVSERSERNEVENRRQRRHRLTFGAPLEMTRVLF
jgi:hypothetical protein